MKIKPENNEDMYEEDPISYGNFGIIQTGLSINMNKLKKIRVQQGLSQSLLSKKANVSLRSLQAYEQGDRDLNKAQAETVYKLAKALNCKMEELIDIQKDLD